jgi:hypothetical protein
MRFTPYFRQAWLVVAAAMLTACNERPAEYGVSVFSTDTLPVTFTVTLTGSLALGLRSENFRMLKDKSLVLSTPAEMVVQRGDGTARIVSTKGQSLAVQPLGIGSDSSADTVTVVGPIVMLVKPPDRRVVKLSAEKK